MPLILPRPHEPGRYHRQDHETLAERFERNVIRLPDLPGCWLWIGERIGEWNYGGILIGPKPYKYAHRVSYEMFVGLIPAKMQVLHRCDVGPCVNPAHLFLGTQRDNIRDLHAKRRH